MHSILFSYLTHWRSAGYALIFIGMLVEGDILIFSAFFLAHQGFFDLGDLGIFVVTGALLGDSLWYLLGRFIDNHVSNNSRMSFVTRCIARIAMPLDSHLRDHPYRTVFISKFTYGLHHALLTRLGMQRFPWKKFIHIDVIATLPWILAVGGLGYFSGAAFLASKRYLRFAEAGLLFSLIFFLVVEHFVTKKLRP